MKQPECRQEKFSRKGKILVARPKLGRSVPATAGYPNSARDGYPWAMQKWDPEIKKWRWTCLGIGDRERKSPERTARDVLLYHSPGERMVWVKRWVAIGPRSKTRFFSAPKGGWRAVIDSRRIYEVAAAKP